MFENSTSQKQSNIALFLQVFSITSSTTVCWIPCCVLYVWSLFSPQQVVDLVIWSTIALVPIDSMNNPIVFPLTTVRKALKKIKPNQTNVMKIWLCHPYLGDTLIWRLIFILFLFRESMKMLQVPHNSPQVWHHRVLLHCLPES